MSDTFQIQSATKNHLVIDIKATNVLDVNSPNANSTQIWEAAADAAYPGYFFIQSSKPDSNGKTVVIDIRGVTKATVKGMNDSTPLDVYPKKDTEWHENQLWTVGLNPGSTPNVTTQGDSFFIQSYLTNSSGKPFVIDIFDWKPGTEPTAGATLDAYPQKMTNVENQLWNLAINPEWKFAPKITGFIPDITSPASKSLVTVVGTGFVPGATLLFSCGLKNNNGFSQPGPILGVSDFAGKFSVTASVPAWGLGEVSGSGFSFQEGLFSVGVAYNSGTAPLPVIASASAQWIGEGFKDFTSS